MARPWAEPLRPKKGEEEVASEAFIFIFIDIIIRIRLIAMAKPRAPKGPLMPGA